ncbi:hypothetical protein AK812_SmicGene16803 [Symbiodinium microadriaticum]|uniref:NAD-dependent epimerase/dehydratase domain-containing protein n=1 Tax=Symbiodinium microadriaticum TaxID=2951 RepID=A0A1Q9DZC3_SYMMI|nr:hypothetical protein AK812_SmicGene16803 [Symbiodinium microadriaticum]
MPAIPAAPEVPRSRPSYLLIAAGLMRQKLAAQALPTVIAEVRPVAEGRVDVFLEASAAFPEEFQRNMTMLLQQEPSEAPMVGRFLLPALEQDGGSSAELSSNKRVRPDVIVHTADEMRDDYYVTMMVTSMTAPVSFGASLEEAFAERGTEALLRFVFLSTDQVYDGKGLREDQARDGIRPLGSWTVYCRKSVMLLHMEVAASQVVIILIEIMFVYGPVVVGAHSTFLQFALDKLRSGEPFDAIRSCIFIHDVVEALRLAVQATHIVNVANQIVRVRSSRVLCRI